MKCAKCGAKIKPGCVYCSVCGKEAQIVPDYNMEEDYLKSILQKEQNPSKPKREGSDKKSGKPERKKKTGIYIAAVFVAVLLILLAAGIYLIKSQSYDGKLQKAENYYGKGNYKQAIAYAKKALEKNKKGMEALLILGKCYQAQGDQEKAEECLELAFSASGGNEEICELLIQIYEKKGDYGAITKLYGHVEKKELKKLFKNYLIKAPSIKPEGGKYGEYPEITMDSPTGTDIYFTLDGSDPKAGGTLYKRPFFLEEEGEIHISAVCEDARGIYSPNAEEIYHVTLDVPELPTASPGSGTYTQQTQITIDVPKGCRAYYAWNGTPGTNTACYTGPFEMIPGNNVLAIVVVNGSGKSSGVQKYNYIYMP